MGIVIVCGTSRPGAMTREVSRYIAGVIGESCPASVLDLADFEPDAFSPEIYGEKPEWFITSFQDPLLAAKGVVIVTPEYNGSFPGLLKHYIDLLKFPESFNGQPVGLIGVAAGQFGALRSVEQLSTLLQYRRANVMGEHVLIPRVRQVFSDGKFSSEIEERLAHFSKAFIEFSGACTRE